MPDDLADNSNERCYPPWFSREAFFKVRSNKIKIQGVGEILMERSRRAKHIRITVRPFKGVRVAVPFGVSLARAETFARSKAEWMKKHLCKMHQLEQAHKTFSENYIKIDKATAKKKLVNRLNELSEQHGLPYNRVFIRNQKTRWGSCSAKDNISLNCKLANLPEELIDYIMLHELVHTRVKNHSKKFWQELNKFVGNARKLDKRLNEYRMLLID